MRIIYLATDAYGGHGGIALFSRYVIAALMRHPATPTITVVPRIAGDGSDPVPAGVGWRPDAARSAAAYAWTALRARPADLVFSAHVNLLPVAAAVKATTGARIIQALHGTEAWDPFEKPMSRRTLRFADHVLAVSQFTLDRFTAWSHWPAAKASVIPNAIEPELYGDGPKRADLVARYGLAGRKVIMLLGRMHPTEGGKGFDELIEALPAIRAARPEAMLLLAGGGDDRARLAAKAAALGQSDHVVFTGRVDEAEKADHYRLADAHVMPSRQEGFGFVHLEAMACGTPTVASIADGAFDAVRGGAIGGLVDPADPASVVAAALAAIDRPRGVPAGLDHFTFDAFADRVNLCVDQVLKAR